VNKETSCVADGVSKCD